jgi:RimJ/RimL family protein N-acetyltransferase
MGYGKKKDKVIFIEGKNIILRPLQRKDINFRYLKWINDPEVTKFMTTGVFPTTLKELENYYKGLNKHNNIMLAIIIKSNKRHIGNIKLGNINWVHRYADLGIMIGEKKYWGKEYGVEAIKLILDYAFGRLNLNKVILGVYAIHTSAIRAYQKIGFKIEGKIKKIFFMDGEWVDKFIMGILKEEFESK